MPKHSRKAKILMAREETSFVRISGSPRLQMSTPVQSTRSLTEFCSSNRQYISCYDVFDRSPRPGTRLSIVSLGQQANGTGHLFLE